MGALLERLRLRIGPWVARLNISPARIRPLACLCLGFKRDDRWVLGWLRLGDSEKDGSLFHNGIVFARMMLPFFVGVGIRWAGSNPGRREFAQAYAGWKLNGEFSVVLRIQSDQSAARGTSGPNTGQAIGWDEGTK